MPDPNLIARVETYKALAGCFFLPDYHLLQNAKSLAVHAPSWVPGIQDSALALIESLPCGKQDYDALKVEHAKLFLGPFEVLAPPFGSVYFHVNKMLSHESTDDVAEHYRQAGVTSAPAGGNPPDHVTAELEFMYFLLFQEHAAQIHGDHAALQEWRERRKAFFPIHLGAWGPIFADRVISFAESRFYKHLGLVTKEVFQAEHRLISMDLEAERSESLMEAATAPATIR